MMEIHCEHNNDSDHDDDKLLLDDENATEKSCGKCKKYNPARNGFIKPIFKSVNHYTVAIENYDGLSDNVDSPLLMTQYSDCENIGPQEFHCHVNNLPDVDENTWKKLLSVLLLCIFFMITEIIGGYLADSLAVMTDAAHLFSDLVGFIVSILSIWISRKSPTRIMTFGFYRAEVLGAFLSVLAVWILAGIFCLLAIDRLLKNEYEIDADTMLIVSSIGVLVNIIMGAVLHGFCQSHSHGHSHGGHGHSHSNSHSHDQNINVRAAAAHVLGDLLQSIGVLLAATIIKIYPDAKMADPICTLLFSIIVVYTTFRVAIDAIKILLEASPKPVGDIMSMLIDIPGVKHVHDVHVWSLSPGKDAVSLHLAVDQYCDRNVVLQQATCFLRNYLPVVSCTIQTEEYNEVSIASCTKCQL